MKNVCHIITTIDRGGAENQLVVLVREQIKRGLQVQVIYLKGNAELKNVFKSMGVTLIDSLANKSVVRQYFRLKKIFRNSEVLIHAHLPRAELLARLAMFRFNQLILSRHNAEPFFPKAPKFISAFLSRVVTRRAQTIISISEAVKKSLLEYREITDSEKIFVVHYGYTPQINPDRLTKKISCARDSDFIVGTISRLTKQKDLPTLLMAFAKFYHVNPLAKLVVIGDGPDAQALLSTAVHLGISDRIDWVGRTGNIAHYLSSMDVFVLSSIYEGFGQVLLEAMDAGVPIIASDVSAIPEVLGNDFAGLVKPGDSDGFLDAMKNSMSLSFRKALLQAQNVRLNLFNAEIMCTKILEIYDITS